MKTFSRLTIVTAIWFVALHIQAWVAFTTLVSFTYTNPPNYGWNANTYNHRTCALVQADDGNFYGTTYSGGAITLNRPEGYGTIFKLTSAGAFTNLHSFGSVLDNLAPLDGLWPVGNLIKGVDGAIYGTTWSGGYATSLINGFTDRTPNGTAFLITTNGFFANLYSFGNNLTIPAGHWINYDGGWPLSGLVLGQDGNFYGTTASDGAYGWGTVFKLTPYGFLTTLHSFTTPPSSEGYEPYAELVEGNDANYYGTTSAGGLSGRGTIFKITPAGTFTTLITFDGANGSGPYGGLMLGKDGNFYGTTIGDGSHDGGTVFRLTTNGVLTTLHHFLGPDGMEPHAALIQGSDGNLYGTTEYGGNPLYNAGTVFQISTNGAFKTLYKFSGLDGERPEGALVQGKNGSFYGTTSYGGFGYGTIFRITIPPAFQSQTVTNGVLTLNWSILPGQTYQLQFTTNLASTNWFNLGSLVTATNVIATASDTATNSQCFYRIQLLP